MREAVRAIYVAFDPMHGSIGRDDSAGDTQPQLRPPTDLRGIPAALVSLQATALAGMGQLCQRRLLPVPEALGAFAGERDKYGEQKSKHKRNMQAAAPELNLNSM